MMANNCFLDLRTQLTAALRRPLPPAEARFRVKLCLADIGKALTFSDLAMSELEAALQDPFGIDDVATLEGIVSRLRKCLSHVPEVAWRLPVLSFWIAALGGPVSRWHLGCHVAQLSQEPADGLDQLSPAATIDETAGLAQAWTEHEAMIGLGRSGADAAEATVVQSCANAVAAFLAYHETERALAGMPQGSADFVAACERADDLQRRWEELLDNVCRLPARTPVARYSKSRVAELLTKMEPVTPGAARLSVSLEL